MLQGRGDRTNGQQATTEKHFATPPATSLPKGGGAIRGMGEKFAANPITGTGSTTVPIAISPSRSGFGPELALSYDSGAGNGPFGFGWNLSLPAITRKTDKGLPQYRDAEEADVFILSGVEDLVPLLDPNGSRYEDTDTVTGYTIHRYRPRIEGLFARIERWTRGDGDIHWRSISKGNILTLYGKDENSRIVDPGDPRRVFSWLICETRDDKGNAVLYEYKPEDGADVDLTQAHERNRGDRASPLRTANRYLKRILYGNRVSLLDKAGHRPRFLTQVETQNAGWMFEVVFDYGEHYTEDDQGKPTSVFIADDQHPWTVRKDPFSSYRAGFEVRTYRLCRRVLMFHHFPDELGSQDYLVRATHFTYRQSAIASFVTSVTQSGYVRQENGTYLKKSLPPLEFEYRQAIIDEKIQELDGDSLENLPYGLDGTTYQWVDLDGEGVSGILTEQAGAWFYKPNLGEGKFGPLEKVAAQPSLAALSSGRQQLLDLAGDGQLDLVEFAQPMSGFFERTHDQDWKPFTPFTSLPNIPWDDPNLRFVDLNGDGHADVLITEHEVLTWYPSLAEEGFSSAQHVRKPIDEERGPRLVFADGTQSVYLADMSGDGLTDLVRITNGAVCYWPNLGYGRFGARVQMDNAPWFDFPDQFDQRRIRVADIDGSGNTDILYLGHDSVKLYFNESGNRWSEPGHLRQFPRIDNLASVTAVDLLGNGTACLVWSSPLPSHARRPMHYIDLMGGQKPHLLVKTVNNLGAETHVHYAPSTTFYLADKQAGNPWITRLPFPVHVVERVETHDYISGNRFVTTYSYHHGYFDGEEGEFRGFGMVEQRDTEEFAVLTADGKRPDATNLDAASHVPPVLTRSWFHTGLYLGRNHVSDFFAGLFDEHDRGGYYREPAWHDDDAEARERLLPDTVMPPNLTLAEEREACRALKGMMLRQEVYALDGTGTEDYPFGHPYTVTEQNFTISVLQERGDNRHAVFFTHPREVINYHYERNPDDPRITHTLTLEVDAYGNVLKEVAIGYGRRQSDATLPLQADRDKQTRPLIIYTENRVTKDPKTGIIDTANDYRTPLPCEARTYELTGFKPENGAVRFSFDEWTRNDFALLNSAAEIPYEQTADNATKQKRLIEHIRTLYRKDDLTAFLALGELEPLALPGESYKLALTPGLLAHVFKRKRPSQQDEELLPDPAPLLKGKSADQGGYVMMDGNWWIPSGKVFFDPKADVADPAATAAQELTTARQHFYLPRKVANPFDQSTMGDYDVHDLLVTRTSDALDNTVVATNDYRVLQPKLVTDPNRNRTAAAFDALGMVAATAVMGKEGENLGDLLEDFDADPPLAGLQAFIADPQARAAPLLGKATTRIVYDLERYRRAGQPPLAATLARETHVHDPGGEKTKIQVSFSYSDGFGREIQTKIQAEGGDAPQRQADVLLLTDDIRPGDLIRDANGKLVWHHTPRRWVGTGRTVFNNKGKPVRQYEPFFSATHLYEPEREMTDTGVSPVLFYDPLERVVATLHPNHTYEKVAFDPWHQAIWDVNDTVLQADPKDDPHVGAFFRRLPDTDYLPTWYESRQGQQGAAEGDAATKAAAHANTPSVAYLDTLGRTFLTLADNGSEGKYSTRVELDIEGTERTVIDAKERVVMRYDYDMLGKLIRQASIEAGERWMLNDAVGNPIRTWDSRRFLRRMTYDKLRRPTGLYVTENGGERLAERTVYGESQGDVKNHLARVYQLFDGAGIVTSVAYDFKGNLLESRRDLLPDYKQAVNWQQNLTANDGTFISLSTYDALNRPLTVTTPDGSIYRPTFNEANLLDKVDVNLRGEQEHKQPKWTPFVTNIDYNAKGQRKQIDYENGAQTTYDYDPLTFRLIHLKTTRPSGLNGVASQIFAVSTVVQDLHYTYDPAGNITRIEDSALKPVFHANQQVEPVCNYTYDAIYRLIETKGREHVGQTAHDFNPPNRRDFDFTGLAYFSAHPSDLQALRNYTERYEYDEVGNFQVMRHIANGGGWTRHYDYEEDSLIEPGKKSNRLTKTTMGNGINFAETYTYTDNQGNDVHGCMTAINTMKMVWDFEDQLQQVDLGGGGTAYYVYDAGGQRVRKVIELQNGTSRKERIYLGGYEVYREYTGNNASKTLERESLHVMDDQQRIALVETQTIANGNAVSAPVQRYQLGNHLGSTSVELDNDAALVSYEEYHPYGTTAFQAGRSATEVSLKRYRYTGKERDEETGFSYHGARYYVPWLGRWASCDRVKRSININLFQYVRGNPIGYWDPDGNQETVAITFYTRSRFSPITEPNRVFAALYHRPTRPASEADVAKSALAKTDTVKPVAEVDDPELPKPSDKPSEVGFIIRNPLKAGSIGPVSRGTTNISTIAVRFATRIGLQENKARKGSEVNAYRHSLWQAMITTKFGEATAREVGYAHESSLPNNLRSRTFTGPSALDQADQIADLLNNVIGRGIGRNNPKLSSQELAIKVLEQFHEHGLFTARHNPDGSVDVVQTKIPDDTFNKALGIIKGLNNSGFTKAEQDQINATLEKVKRMDRGPKW